MSAHGIKDSSSELPVLLHERVVGGCIRDPLTKTSHTSWYFLQASSTEQLDQSNLIIFHAYMV